VPAPAPTGPGTRHLGTRSCRRSAGQDVTQSSSYGCAAGGRPAQAGAFQEWQIEGAEVAALRLAGNDKTADLPPFPLLHPRGGAGLIRSVEAATPGGKPTRPTSPDLHDRLRSSEIAEKQTPNLAGRQSRLGQEFDGSGAPAAGARRGWR
jgi:hypothetical protein